VSLLVARDVNALNPTLLSGGVVQIRDAQHRSVPK
jgi:hypothetical protein